MLVLTKNLTASRGLHHSFHFISFRWLYLLSFIKRKEEIATTKNREHSFYVMSSFLRSKPSFVSQFDLNMKAAKIKQFTLLLLLLLLLLRISNSYTPTFIYIYVPKWQANRWKPRNIVKKVHISTLLECILNAKELVCHPLFFFLQLIEIQLPKLSSKIYIHANNYRYTLYEHNIGIN